MKDLTKYSRPFHIAAGLITVLIIGLVDYLTGPGTSLAIFYLVPIVQVTWFGGLAAGLVAALGSAGAWLLGELLSGPPGQTIPAWNVILVFGFLLAVSLVLSAFRGRLLHESALATVDTLTGVANARHFREAIQTEKDRALRYKHPITLAHVGVDGFPHLQRRLGRRTANALLRTVASTIRENLRSSDLIARLSGHEFGIMLVEAEAEEVQAVIVRTQQRLAEAMQRHGWPVTFSFGVITFGRPASPAEEMLRLVADLVTLVKAEGKGLSKFEVYSD